MPSTIQGRGSAANFASIASRVSAGTGRLGSRVGNGTFIAAISAGSQSIGSSWKWLWWMPGLVMNRRRAPSAKSKTDAPRHAAEPGRQRRPNGAIENPDSTKVAFEELRQPQQIEPTPQFRAAMLGIQHFGYARLGVQQVPGTGAGRGQERYPAARRGSSDGANERQMPNHIADAGLDLNDRGRTHVACRLKDSICLPSMILYPAF